jgi:hypothetical protein
MGTMAGGEEPTAGIRVSDAERDAAVERLSAATGDGRLTLQEFSQRMELATAARTRADLDGLVADLPAAAATAGSAVAGPPSWHVSPIGGLRIRGPWRMDRHVIVVSLVGGARLDLSQAQLAAPQVMLTKVSLVGGTKVTVPPGIRVEASGFSLIGGTRIDAGPQPGPGAPIVRIRAFALVGGIRIRRSGTSERLRQQHHGLAARSLQDASERAGGVFQGEGGTDREPDCPGGEQFTELGQPRPVRCHIHLADPDAALGARRIGRDRREPAAVLDCPERAGRAAGDGVDGQIGAAAGGKHADLAWPVR